MNVLGKRNKIKKGKKKHANFGVSEPVRTSLLDCTLENLAAAKREIYLLRIIYIGEHNFNSDDLHSTFNDIIQEVNRGYCDESLSGMFLYYKKFFVHILEGCEDSIEKHFHLILGDEISSYIESLKVVTVINHINQKFFNEWISMVGKPVTLLEKIDPDCDLDKSSKYIQNFINKVYHLCSAVREVRNLELSNSYDSVEFMQNSKNQHATRMTVENISTSIDLDNGYIEELLKPHYPEINLLQFLIQTKYLIKVSEYVEAYGSIVIPGASEEKIWPIPHTMIPYHIFDKYVDPVIDLPTHKEEKQDDEIGRAHV